MFYRRPRCAAGKTPSPRPSPPFGGEGDKGRGRGQMIVRDAATMAGSVCFLGGDGADVSLRLSWVSARGDDLHPDPGAVRDDGGRQQPALWRPGGAADR